MSMGGGGGGFGGPRGGAVGPRGGAVGPRGGAVGPRGGGSVAVTAGPDVPAGPDAPERSARSLARDRALLGRVVHLFAGYRWQLVVIALTILVTAGLGVASPLLIKVAFDQALFVANGPKWGLLSTLVGLMIAIPVVSGAIGVYQAYLTNDIGQQVMRDLRAKLYAHLQAMPLRFFTGTRTGEIQSRLANDVGGLQSVVTETASTLLSNMVIILSTVIAMSVLSWQLTLLSLALLPVFAWLTTVVGERRRRVSGETQEALAEMTAITQETLSVSGVLLAKTFGRQQSDTTRYAEQNERLAKLQVRGQMIGRSFFAVVSTFFSVMPAVVYWLAGFSVHATGGGITAGTLVAFTTLQTRLFFPIGQLLQTSTEVQSSLALFERVFGYLDLESEITDAPDAVPLAAPVRGRVTFDDVRFSYGEGGDTSRWALDGVSFDLEPGTLAAIVGPSGAGKTTISYLVPRLYDATAGRVMIDGLDVRDATLESVTGAVGMVTQESYLFHASIRANLAYGRPGASEQEIQAAARAAQIHDRIREFPDGYDTIVGERGFRLSGGEKQRLAIARVLLKDPAVLILDEATSALDTANERLVQAALQPLTSGRTTIAIAHRLSTIRAADVILVMDSGRLVERGTHDELVAAGGVYADLFDAQYGGGAVEARCADGMVLTDGHVVAMDPQPAEPTATAPRQRGPQPVPLPG